MSNISFPSTSTLIGQSSFKPNQSSILGTVDASYIDGVNIYIANNSAFSSSYVNITIITNTINPITIYNDTFTIEPQNVLVIQNVYNISNSTISVFVSENNNTKGYIVYDTDYTSEVPNSNSQVPLTQFSSNTSTSSTSSSDDNAQLTQLQYLITSQINNLTTQVNALSNEVQGSFTTLKTASQYGTLVNNLSSQVSTLINNLNVINGNISQLTNTTSTIPVLQASTTNIQNNIADLSSAIDSYYQNYTNSINETNDTVANIEEVYNAYNDALVTIGNMSSDVTILQANQDKTNTLLEGLSNIDNITGLAESISNVNNKIDTINTQLNNVFEDISSIQGTTNDNSSSITTLENDVTNLENEYESILTLVNKNITDIQTNLSSIDNIESDLSSIDSTLSTVSSNASNALSTANTAITQVNIVAGKVTILDGVRIVAVEKFGAKGNGSAEDAPAFVDAASYLSNLGGGSILATKSYYINENFTLPDFVGIVGHFQSAATTYNTNLLNSGSSTLIINPANVITGSDTSGITGMIMFQSEFPNNGNSDTTPTFQGTAFQIGLPNNSSGQVNGFTKDCAYIGFNLGFASWYSGRTIVDNLTTFCNQAIQIEACYDIARINRVHQNFYIWNSNWTHPQGPFIFINGGGSSWQQITNCFTYGSVYAFEEANSGNNIYTRCGSDGNFPAAGGPSGQGSAFLRTGLDFGASQYIGCQCTGNYGFSSLITGLPTGSTGVQYTDGSSSSVALSGQTPWPQMQIIGGQAWGPSTGDLFQIGTDNWVDVTNFMLQPNTLNAGSIASGGGLVATGGTPLNFGTQAGTYTQMYLAPGNGGWITNSNA